MKTNPTNLQELWDQLNVHDWYYSWSDDHRVYSNGIAEEERLLIAAKAIEDGADLFKRFSSHLFSGESWNTKESPKPDRPT